MMFKTNKEEEKLKKNFGNADLSKILKVPIVDIKGIKSQKLVIGCLEYTIGIDMVIKWTKNDELVGNRILNEFNQLEFKKLKYSDSGRFDCYLNDKRVAQYNLRIQSKNDESRNNSKEFDKYVDLIIKIIILISILLVLQMIFNILYSLCLEKKRIEVLKKSKNFHSLGKLLRINLEILENDYLNELELRQNMACEDSESIEDDESVLNDT